MCDQLCSECRQCDMPNPDKIEENSKEKENE